jgi:hypothetical protein
MFSLTLLALATIALPTWAQKPKTPPTKGQGQLVGGDGRLGTIYTLKSDWNFVIYSAHYSMEPYPCYMHGDAPHVMEKLLVLDVAFKNTMSTNNSLLFSNGQYTAVDSTGQLYSGFDAEQESQGNKGPIGSLRPGQGIGQPELKDGVHLVFHIPGSVRIVKIMVNTGRKLVNLDEKVFRYYIAGATKAEAGADGDPKNVIAPLPDNVADPSDKSGATALDEGKGAPGQELPSGAYHLKINSAMATTDPVMGNPPRDGKKYVVLNVTAKMMTDSADKFISYVEGDSWQLTDSDGDRYKADSFLKASTKADVDHEWVKGDEYTFRVVFIVPKEATFKKVVIGAGDHRKWAFDGSIIQ